MKRVLTLTLGLVFIFFTGCGTPVQDSKMSQVKEISSMSDYISSEMPVNDLSVFQNKELESVRDYIIEYAIESTKDNFNNDFNILSITCSDKIVSADGFSQKDEKAVSYEFNAVVSSVKPIPSIKPDENKNYPISVRMICAEGSTPDSFSVIDYKVNEKQFDNENQLLDFLGITSRDAKPLFDYTLKGLNRPAVYLGNDCLAYLSNETKNGISGLYLRFINVETGKELSGSGINFPNYSGLINTNVCLSDNQILVSYASESDPSAKLNDFYSIDGKLLTVKQSIDTEITKNYLPGSNACILTSGDGLYLLDEKTNSKTLLLKNKKDTDEMKDTRFHFTGAIDGNRFLYSESGYEWTVGNGFFDISTMKDIKIPSYVNGNETYEHASLIGVFNNKIYLLWSDYSLCALVCQDLNNLASKPVLLNCNFDPDMITVCGDGKYFATTASSGEESYTFLSNPPPVRIFDLATGKVIKTFDNQQIGDISAVWFDAEDTLHVLSTLSNLGSYIYTYQFK